MGKERLFQETMQYTSSNLALLSALVEELTEAWLPNADNLNSHNKEGFLKSKA